MPSASLLTRNVNPQSAPHGEDKVRGTAHGNEKLAAGYEGRPSTFATPTLMARLL
jgi:hypothetical protein